MTNPSDSSRATPDSQAAGRTYTWSDERARAIELFRDAPSATTEAEILDVFKQRPALVATTITRVGEAVARGEIRSGWPVLRSRASAAAGSGPELVVTDGSERERAVAAAQRWLRTVGVHFDREHEIEAALFEDGYGDRGATLAPWTDDSELRARLLKLWCELRGAGERADAEAHERLARQGRAA